VATTAEAAGAVEVVGAAGGEAAMAVVACPADGSAAMAIGVGCVPPDTVAGN